MLELKDIQNAAVTAIQAGEYFSGVTVLKDDGTILDELEAAVTDSGMAIAVGLPIAGKLYAQTIGSAHLEVTLPVEVQVNPKVNAAGANRDINEAAMRVASALLGYHTANDTADNFELDDNPLALITTDGGLLIYVLLFKKLTFFSELETT